MLSPYLAAIVLAWVVAQGSKFLISSVKQWGTVDLRQLYLSGNMPSAHTATVVSLMTTIGLIEGVETSAFALATLFAVIVMYDAVMVRRSAGEQGAAIHALIKEQKSKVNVPRAAKGHEPLEVAVGAIIGLAVGLFVFFVTRY
jgi:acid phosphatase family membrane protein YuiD